MRNYRTLAALVVASLALLVAKPATAAFSVTLTANGVDTQTFPTLQGDGTILITLSDLSGALAAGNYFTSLNITANPNGSTPTLASLNTTEVQVTNSGVLNSLHVVISRDFTTPTGPTLAVGNTLGVSSSDFGSGTVSVSQKTQINGVDATAVASTGITGFDSQGAATSNLTFGPVLPISPFNMTTDVMITFTSPDFNGTIQSNSSAMGPPGSDVPEPASIAVWGGLMAALAIGFRVRRSG